MKLIDKNYRLFGKISVFDVFVIIVVIFAVVSIVYVKPKKPEAVNDPISVNPHANSEYWLEVYGRTFGIMDEVSQLVKEGDCEVTSNGVVLSKIEKVLMNEKHNINGVWGDDIKKIKIKFLVRVVPEKGKYLARSQYIKIGQNFSFMTDSYNLNFDVYKIGELIKQDNDK